MIKLTNVSKWYLMGEIRVTALDQVSLDIAPGEFVVVLGPSGSGKTTLLNMIGALDSPSEGEIKVDDADLAHSSRAEQFKFRRQTIGFVFQSFNLFPGLTALENVQFVLDVVGRKGRNLAREALQGVGLGQRVGHFPHQLSGGEQQRVAIARALGKDAPILLADEPTGELDFGTGVQILELLKQQAEAGKTVVIVTHNREIARISDRVVELHSGRVASDGPPKGGPVSVSELMW
jgi:putative ABC transport system ATP-binding protein